MTTRRCQDWDGMCVEVRTALGRYKDDKIFINKTHFTEWVLRHCMEYPLLTRNPYGRDVPASKTAVCCRISRCINQMGWMWHSKEAFVSGDVRI